MKTLPFRIIPILIPAFLFAASDAPAPAKPDFTKDKTFYVVGYAHLDTQWRWDYRQSIVMFLPDTMNENFRLFEKYPNYTFNFGGSFRFELMKEYYPERWDEVKKWVKAGRWHVAGAMVEETDANVPSPESIIRNALYGNGFARRELGVESNDFLLPDCFGFQASLPSVLAHCGLVGFGTQKLSWGSANGIPFNVGVWEGPDGKSLIGALNGGSYTGMLEGNFTTSKHWVKRLEETGKKTGFFLDYRYYGTGDRGGAPKEQSIKNLEKLLKEPGAFRMVSATSEQMYNDISPEVRAKLPVYKGDLLLTEHSAGSLTSQAEMKRCNRKNEQLAQAAEAACVAGDWLGALAYPGERFANLWNLVIASQMHDTMPGTCLPQCYDLSYNDEMLALKGFAAQLTDGVSAIAANVDTSWCKGTPVVVFNPLATEREELVEIAAPSGGAYDAAGHSVPCTMIAPGKLLVQVRVPAFGVVVLDRRLPLPGEAVAATLSSLSVSNRSLENTRYKVTVNDAGDIASVFDKKLGKELLSAPAQIQFLREYPSQYPAWNMDWADRKEAPEGVLGGPAEIRIKENSPLRVALEITRKGRDSTFVQTVSLAAGDTGDRVEIATKVDWRGQKCSVKHAFPLTAKNPLATYNMGLGTVQRGTNEKKKYEVPSREWMDLTDASGAFGVTLLEDCRFGSDKPDDNTLRLTLLFTPQTRGDFQEQKYQDWGRHEMTYALRGHAGDTRDGSGDRAGRSLNQPLRAFVTTKHPGAIASGRSFLSLDNPAVDVRAFKKAEDGQSVIVRLQELTGKDGGAPVTLTFGDGIADAWEVDGQERKIGPARVVDGKLAVGPMTHYACRAFAIVPKKPAFATAASTVSLPVNLAAVFDADVMSTDANRADGDFAKGLTYPAEMIPAVITDGGITFKPGSGMKDGDKNAVVCRGQKIAIPAGKEVHLLVAADGDLTETIGGVAQTIPAWKGAIANWDAREFDGGYAAPDHEPGDKDYKFPGHKLLGIKPGFTKPGRIAWCATHHHAPVKGSSGNVPYDFSHLFHVSAPLAAGQTELVLPNNPKLKVFAVTVASPAAPAVTPAAPLHDDWSK